MLCGKAGCSESCPSGLEGAGRKRALETTWRAALPPYIAIHPGGFLDRVSAPDPDIPTGLANTPWYLVPDVWWNVVERLSWTMLGKPQSVGCKFRPVANTGK